MGANSQIHGNSSGKKKKNGHLPINLQISKDRSKNMLQSLFSNMIGKQKEVLKSTNRQYGKMDELSFIIEALGYDATNEKSFIEQVVTKMNTVNNKVVNFINDIESIDDIAN